MKVLETAAGAVFALTRFSLVRISLRDQVADGNSLVRNSGVGGGGRNLTLKLWANTQSCAAQPLSITNTIPDELFSNYTTNLHNKMSCEFVRTRSTTTRDRNLQFRGAFSTEKAVFPFSRGKNRISQGVCRLGKRPNLLI